LTKQLPHDIIITLVKRKELKMLAKIVEIVLFCAIGFFTLGFGGLLQAEDGELVIKIKKFPLLILILVLVIIFWIIYFFCL
jgi:hypothetical protein